MSGFFVLFAIMLVVVIGFIIYTVLVVFNSKVRGRFMSKQVKARRYMMDEVKDDIKSVSTDMAEATKEGIEITARAIKDGLTDKEDAFCKHCGEKIDNDSKFCSKCGKKL